MINASRLLSIPEEVAKLIRKDIVHRLTSKYFLSMVTLMLALITLCSTTFSWYVSEDVKTNTFQSANLTVEIQEDFRSTEQLLPGQKLEKRITVMNKGSVPALVRVSLQEFMAVFKIDLPTGNLFLRPKSSSDVLASQIQGKTWLPGTLWPAYIFDSETNSKLPKTQEGVPLFCEIEKMFTKDRVHNQENGRSPEIENYLSIIWNSSVGTEWIYFDGTNDGVDNGYFYYLYVLDPSASTSPLIDALLTSNDLPNSYKNAPYRLDVYAEGINASPGVLENLWGLSKGNPIYDNLEPYLRSENSY